LSPVELSNLLTKQELSTLFKNELAACRNERKETWISLLASRFTEPQPWLQWTNAQLGELFQINLAPLVETFLLLFFGNPYQDLTEFVLQDLGLFKYENYVIDHHHRIFKTREELTHYQQLIRLREQLEQVETVDDLISLINLLPATSPTHTLERRRAKLCNQLAYALERLDRHEHAYQLYSQSNIPPSRERRIRILEKQGQITSAWEIVQTLIQQPANEHELQVAERMLPRLAKKAGVKPVWQTEKTTLQETHLALPQLMDEHGTALTVEEIAQRHFDSDEQPCFYVENQLINALFGLWLWPQMFANIDGAFANPFQSAPLDLYQEDFLKKRPEIEKQFQFLQNEQHVEQIKKIWRQKNGIVNHFVNWESCDETLLEIALACIPGEDLKHIFERMLFDIKSNRSGFPDLIQFYPAQKRYRMIEIKGPGDRLQDNQIRWLQYFKRKGIAAEVCYVSWK
ncbi:MAG TPA: VRR-NUC domain-containing protein, partial [Methanosarcina sp.]|nr:VRR-NUC domain-containing protein [Methanosarcina sp.]